MSNLVLYRKFRSLSFADLVGQNHVKLTLTHAVANHRLGHAYLFCGPRGVGKTSVARILARAVNCPNAKEGEPCNECEICKEFLNGTSLDVLEIDAASHTGVDNIRELIEHLQFAPTRAQYKVIIIDEVHMLSRGAFNALLKSLEEPPAHAIFILATTEVHKLPATIVSRTQRFDFKKGSVADLTARLKFVCKQSQISASEEAIAIIAQSADGSFRDALSLLDQVASFASGEITPELVEDVLGKTSFKSCSDFFDLILSVQTLEAVRFVSELSFAGRDLLQFQKDFLEYLRQSLLLKVGVKTEIILPEEQLQKCTNQIGKISLDQLVRIIEVFQKSGSELKWTAIQSLPLELAAVEAISLSESSVSLRGAPQKSPAATKQSVSSEEIATSRRSGARQDNDPQLLQQVTENWPKILEKLKDYNHSLIPSLKLAHPVEIIDQELVVTFPYKFHKDAVEQRKNKIVVDQVIEEVTGLKLMIKPVVEKDWQANPRPTDEKPAADSGENLMESALKIMGGEVES
ncbi:MAG TPA: DNA polymerase III subunit gamma/tau [Patescibacteria group bacterium]|nr:DNA polymerase III subunit gamma/tau [Patescibacteria group bacterium]